jgi:AI-2 transport protein TqsA
MQAAGSAILDHGL